MFQHAAPRHSDHVTPVARVVVLPDLHGDLNKAITALRLAGAVDGSARWVAAPGTVVVQIGDQVDARVRTPTSASQRGSRGRQHECHDRLRADMDVIFFFDDLDRQARTRGGRVYSMLGNHEAMNCMGDMTYADTCAQCLPKRIAVFASGGQMARHLASTRFVVLDVAGVLFAHAGVARRHLKDLGDLQSCTSRVLSGVANAQEQRLFDDQVMGPGGVLCHRGYFPGGDGGSRAESAKAVQEVLRTTGCSMIVLGHNAHAQGITSSHSDRVWVVDPGVSPAISDAPAACLEITPSRLQSGSTQYTVREIWEVREVREVRER